MKTARTNHVVGLIAALLIAAVAGAGHALEGDVAWDQAKATTLAAQFEEAAGALARTARTEQLEAQNTKSTEAYLIVEDLKSITRYSKRLSSALSKGASKDETQRLFRRLLAIVRDLRDLRRSSPLLANSAAEISSARDVLEQLAGFYGETLPPAVAAPGQN
jgi:hypothetical protein